ncbi:MAG: FG-GAP-like repeat-containing protein, partial [bacterium]
TYAEIAQYSGIEASEWSWSNLFVDVDLDGYEDVLVATGHYYDAQDFDAMNEADSRIKFSAMAIKMSSKTPDEKNKLNTILLYPKLELPNIAFRNRGDLTFEEVGQNWGFNSVDISHGMALGDLDNDGDLDVVMNRLNTPAAIYRNESSTPRIAVRLKGLSPNTQGIGAKIRVLGGPVPQSKEAISAGTYLSSSDPLYMFAAEKAKNLTIEVKWRSGKASTVTGARPNRIYEIDESAAVPVPNEKTNDAAQQPFFEDVSHLISHNHHEDHFDDFKKQPLLPNRLSQAGPGVSWFDFDRDGDDDLVITSGKGGRLAYFRNDRENGFRRIQNSDIFPKAKHEQTSALGWSNEDGTASLLIAKSNIENSNPGDSYLQQYDFQNGQPKSGAQIIAGNAGIGPMAMADYDLDGDLDLFVGGRSLPAKYPTPASSSFFFNEQGHFKNDSLNSNLLKEIGLVSGAVFSDIDGDGDSDLVLALEWGPVTVFRNADGQFRDATDAFGLDAYPGWWQGVTTGDLNEDGKLDIIATNWGLNHKYQGRFNDAQPLNMFSADFDNNGYYDIIEAYYDNELQTLVPERNLIAMMRGIPIVRMRIPDNKKYSRSGIQAIIGPRLQRAENLQANTLSHTVFFNRGEKFEAVAMPVEAQFSPAFYAGVADFDGDGYEDVFVSQNFFATQAETPRADAGRGLWLKGDGTGNLQSVPASQSGVAVYGEQRGAALSDYDKDGRIDLVVSQNGAATKLYHNTGAKPGLRVRLNGPKGNRKGAGATIRLRYESGFGPAREVHLGSGYWSQDSMVQVMGMREKAIGIWVRWPGGKVTESNVLLGAKEVTVSFE